MGDKEQVALTLESNLVVCLGRKKPKTPQVHERVYNVSWECCD